MLRRLIVISLFVVSASVYPNVATAVPCDVTDFECQKSVGTGSDQEAGAVVTKGVQFPGVEGDSLLGQATAANADCANCRWLTSPACVMNGPTEDAMCADAATSCGLPGEIRYRVYLRRPPGPWQLVDTVCLGRDQRPASVADVGEAVRELVVNYLPDAAPSFQPVQGGLVNLPTIFATGEPGSIRTESFDVLGFQVVVTATARWEWTFERGATEAFTEPGGAYPDRSVSYTYRSAGNRDVTVTTYWKASFTVDGDGPFVVPGDEISKTSGPLDVPVRQAGAQLVGG